MTPALEAELAELLPCADVACRRGVPEPVHLPSCLAHARPAILALIREREREVRRETIEAAALVCRHYHESEADEHPNDDERYGAICCEELILKLGGMNNAP